MYPVPPAYSLNPEQFVLGHLLIINQRRARPHRSSKPAQSGRRRSRGAVVFLPVADLSLMRSRARRRFKETRRGPADFHRRGRPYILRKACRQVRGSWVKSSPSEFSGRRCNGLMDHQRRSLDGVRCFCRTHS